MRRMSAALEVLALAITLIPYFLIAGFWAQLPDKVPSHFGLDGTPDSFSSRANLLWVPLESLLLFALQKVGKEFSRTRMSSSGNLILTVLQVEVAVIFTWMSWRQIQTALGYAGGLGALFLVLSVLIIVLTLGALIWQAVRPST